MASLGGQHSFPVLGQFRHVGGERVESVRTQCRKGLFGIDRRDGQVFDLVSNAAAGRASEAAAPQSEDDHDHEHPGRTGKHAEPLIICVVHFPLL